MQKYLIFEPVSFFMAGFKIFTSFWIIFVGSLDLIAILHLYNTGGLHYIKSVA